MSKQTQNVFFVAGVLAFIALGLLGISLIGGRSAQPAAAAQTQNTAPQPLPGMASTAPVAGNASTSDNGGNQVTTASGLTIIDQVVGTGPQPKAGQTVIVNYTGYLDNGTKFDSSFDRNQPLEFVLGAGQVIRGWDEGLSTMKVGGKRRLLVPPELTYGAQGAGGVIPPNARLTFDVELVGVK